MSATTATDASGELPAGGGIAPRNLKERASAVASSAVAVLLGLAPHVLHHAGPLAGAALLAGTGGSLLFGAIGLVAAIPFLVRVHRRCGNWRVPGALLGLFAVMFSISAFVIGPAINGESGGRSKATTNQTTPRTPATDSHAAHHQ
jgi:hypothetical protein